MPRRCSRVLGRRSLFVLAVIVLLTTICGNWPSSAEVRPAPSPGTRTECDPLIPLRVDLVSTTEPTPGGILQLGVEVWSGLDPDEIAATRSVASTIAEVGARQIICHYDLRRGHDCKTLQASAEMAIALGATPWLEAVVASVADYAEEIAALLPAVHVEELA